MKRRRAHYRVICREDDGTRRVVEDFRKWSDALAFCQKNNEASEWLGIDRLYFMKKIYKEIE